MNNRDYKQFLPNYYYHIYNRGNGRMDIYKDDQDYFNFLKRLKLTLGLQNNLQRASLGRVRIQPLPKDSFSIVCYCLMPNHFHFLMRQNKDIPISIFINKVCSSYARYFNKKYDHVGHLLQDQFKAVLVENEEYMTWLSAYIHQNPNVAGISKSTYYKWSSYPSLISEGESICDKEILMDRFKSVGEYVNFVDDSYEAIMQGKIIDKIDLLLD